MHLHRIKKKHFRHFVTESTKKQNTVVNLLCANDNCTAEKIAIRGQIIIGTSSNPMREEAFKKSWDLDTLRRKGMHMESASRSGAEIALKL